MAVFATSGSRGRRTWGCRPVPPAVTPLELVALGHELNGDRLTVRGVVRIRPDAAIDRLTVVVLVFNHEGGFAASGRAIIDAAHAGPRRGVAVHGRHPGVNDVGRYRVSFRTDEGIVGHIDKRER